MKKIWLDEYTDNLQKIDALHEKRRKLPKAIDTVKGSGIAPPYTKRHFTITGADRQQADKIDAEIRKLRDMCDAVEQFIAEVESPKLHNILRWHYIDGDTWVMIGRRVGKGEDAVRKRAMRYIDKKFS